ncbi:hypothetical protein EV363DRAFT_1391696 [Boletus edulis]|nr:hypothetical protein EV363DRAFT_1391696 [Boletus edulis]
MSAYGALSRPTRASPLRLPTTAWPHPRDPTTTVTLFHFNPSAMVDANADTGLFDHLHVIFADEVEKGLTYPQEDMRDPNAFKAYFFAADFEIDLEHARAWDECVVGFYYVRDRLSSRWLPGNGYGHVLARSFLYYAPRLGYEASVFNLVYVNNVASVRLWERLGFVKAGLIPRAGRLRRTDGPGEEYVDAWVFYKRFDDGRVRGQGVISEQV